MSDIEAITAHLDDLCPAPAIYRFVLDLVGREDVWSDRQGAYVSLRPAAEESPIALYVYRDRLEICLEPHRASVRSGSLEGSQAKSVTTATGHWIIPATLILIHVGKVMEGAREAVGWRRDGVRFAQPGKASRKSGQASHEDSCPIHFVPTRMCECGE
jgi:hypothetical protein